MKLFFMLTYISSFGVQVNYCLNKSQIEQVQHELRHRIFSKDGPHKPFDSLIVKLWENKKVFSKCTNVYLEVYSESKYAAYCTTWIYGEIPNNLTYQNFFNDQVNIGICSCVESSNNTNYCEFWQCGGSVEQNKNRNMTSGSACVCREPSNDSYYCRMWECVEQEQHQNGTQITAYQQFQCTNATQHYCLTWVGESKSKDRHKYATCTCINAPAKIIQANQTVTEHDFLSSSLFCQEWKCDEQEEARDYQPRFIFTVVAAGLNALFFLCVGFCAGDEYPRMFWSRLAILFTVGSVCIAICTVASGLLGCLIGLASVFVGLAIYIAIFFIMPLKV